MLYKYTCMSKYVSILIFMVLFGAGCQSATDTILTQGVGSASTEAIKIEDCEKYRWLITENERIYNESQKMQLRDGNNSGEGKPEWNTYVEKNELKDLFYSPKSSSCLYLESRKTLMRRGLDTKTNGGEWGVIYDSWCLVDPSTGGEMMLDEPITCLNVIHRRESYTPADEVERILGEYK